MIRVFFCCLVLLFSGLHAQQALVRLHYTGGGDWYNDPEVLPNLARFFNHTSGGLTIPEQEQALKPTELTTQPFAYITGHGNIEFTAPEISALHDWLLAGGFLYADDDYGMDKAFRREIKKVLPEYDLQEIPPDHPIFNCWFKFVDLPKIHEHDNKPARAYGIFDGQGRLMVFYTYESNISDGWADPTTHNDPEPVRTKALQMGYNILYYAMTR